MYFELFKNDTSGQYWFVIRALGNHQVLATSEMYHRRDTAEHAMQLIDGDRGSDFKDSSED